MIIQIRCPRCGCEQPHKTDGLVRDDSDSRHYTLAICTVCQTASKVYKNDLNIHNNCSHQTKSKDYKL
jgi:hypothetical protein